MEELQEMLIERACHRLTVGFATAADHRDAAALAEELPNSQLIQATWIGELRTRPERLLADIRPFLTQLRLSTMADDLTV